jgi:hypothetical protein
MTDNRVSQPLGRIAEILLEIEAKVSLNEFRDLLEALDSRAYAEGFRDGQENADDRSNEAAERACELRFGPLSRAGN